MDEARHDPGVVADERAESADIAAIAQHLLQMEPAGRHQILIDRFISIHRRPLRAPCASESEVDHSGLTEQIKNYFLPPTPLFSPPSQPGNRGKTRRAFPSKILRRSSGESHDTPSI